MRAFLSIWKHCCGFSQSADPDAPKSAEAKRTDALQVADSIPLFTFAGPSASSLFSFAPTAGTDSAKPAVQAQTMLSEGQKKYRRNFDHVHRTSAGSECPEQVG